MITTFKNIKHTSSLSISSVHDYNNSIYNFSREDKNIVLNLYLEESVKNINLEDISFFSSLIEGEITKEQFIESQLKFSHAVMYYSRPLAICIANIPNAVQRMPVVGNLWEEHGKGNKNDIHENKIITLISRLGGNVNNINKDNKSINVLIFNQLLRGVSSFEDYRFSVAMFAAIERLFVDISSCICNAIKSNNWLEADRITHYELHKEIDIIHAEELLKVVEKEYQKAEGKLLVQQGVKFGLEIFINLYVGLYKEIKEKKSHRGDELLG